MHPHQPTLNRGGDFQFHFPDPPAWAAAAAAMPSKFSCRKLRETGQGFESFLAERGLDLETDRERLRAIYNRDFKPRYGPAHRGPPRRGASAPGGGATFPPRAHRDASPGRSGRSGPGRPPPAPAHAQPAPPLARPLCTARPGGEGSVPTRGSGRPGLGGGGGEPHREGAAGAS